MNLLVHTGMTTYSVIHGPIVVSTLVLSAFFSKTQLAGWSDFLTVSTLGMLVSGSIAILLVGIPYVSNASIDKFFMTSDTTRILWYHGVLLATLGFNTGSLVFLYFYSISLA